MPTAEDSIGAAYLERIKFLQSVRAKGYELDLPQICVVGETSCGKSSLLSMLTGFSFPESAGICTKAPIVVECQYDDSLTADEYFFDAETCASLEALRDRMKIAMEAVPKNVISKDEIRVKVRGPEQMDIIVVDLPGIISDGPGIEESRELILKYCKAHQTLMLVVSEAEQVSENNKAINLAKECDPERKRTLRVLTKFEKFGSPDARKRAREWVTEDRAKELGCHAVVCSSHGGGYDADVEVSNLAGLPPDNAGVGALRKRLPPLFAKLIAQGLPDLHMQVAQRLKGAEVELKKIGTESPSKEEMVTNYQEAVDSSETLEKQLTPHVDALRKAILATQAKVTKQWTDRKFTPNACRLPHFQGEEAAKACMAEIADKWWREPLETFRSKVVRTSEESMDLKGEVPKIISSACLKVVKTEWRQDCVQAHSEFEAKLEEALTKERRFGTVNEHFFSQTCEIAVMPPALLESISEELCRRHAELASAGDDRKAFVDGILQRQRKSWAVQHQDLHQEQQKQRVFEAVLALWEVESRTFLDNVLKVMIHSVVHYRDRWVGSLPNKVLSKAIEEDLKKKQLRDSLKEEIRDMNDIKNFLQELEAF